jgi:glycosyltransferase involved in cell wall biosynthesis
MARLRLDAASVLVRLSRVAERLSIRFADRVITVNEAIKGLISERCGRDDVVVVMNSPDAYALQAGDSGALKRHLRLNSNPALVYVGGINPERDLETLLRAISLLRDRFPIQVVIAGYGEPGYLASVLDFASGLHLLDSVQFLPRIPQHDVLTYLNLSSFGVVSYQENPLTQVAVPTKVFEYAAAGKPMAMARLRALSALFEDAAEFFRPGDAADLAAAIERILTDEGRSRQFVAKARDVLEQCSWAVMEARLLSVYRSLGG